MRNSVLRFTVLTLLLATAQLAIAGTTIVVDAVTSDLPPGSRVRVEAGAEYRLLEFAPVKPEERGRSVVTRSAGDENIKYRLASPTTLVWEFVVPAGGEVPQRQFKLNFPKDLAQPPKGMAGNVSFKIKYNISVPAVNGKPAWQTEQTSAATMRIPADGRWNRCLRVENWGETGVFVGMTPDCVHDIRNDKRGSISRSR